MDYRITITVADIAGSEESADRLLDALLAAIPEAGPVVGQDLGESSLEATFSFEGTGVQEAFMRGWQMFAAALDQSGPGSVQRILGVEIDEVHDAELEAARA